jgi:hypothetical protein
MIRLAQVRALVQILGQFVMDPWINWSSSVQAIGSTKCQLLPPTSYALIPHSQMRVAYLRDNQLERSIVQ